MTPKRIVAKNTNRRVGGVNEPVAEANKNGTENHNLAPPVHVKNALNRGSKLNLHLQMIEQSVTSLEQ